jgi:hypothetical protein
MSSGSFAVVAGTFSAAVLLAGVTGGDDGGDAAMAFGPPWETRKKCQIHDLDTFQAFMFEQLSPFELSLGSITISSQQIKPLNPAKRHPLPSIFCQMESA